MTNTLSQSSLSDLQRRLKAVQREIEAAMSLQMQEMALLQEVIAQRQNNSKGSEFATVRSPRKAVELVIMERGGFMTKQQVLDRLIEGGFLDKDDDTGKWTINDCINYYLRSGRLISSGKGEGWEVLVGFPERSSSSK